MSMGVTKLPWRVQVGRFVGLDVNIAVPILNRELEQAVKDVDDLGHCIYPRFRVSFASNSAEFGFTKAAERNF